VRILLDECLPKDLRNEFTDHEAATVGDMQWLGIRNGQLLTLAEPLFDVFLTADRGMEYQRNFRTRQIMLVVLVVSKTNIESILPLMPMLHEALQSVAQGQITHVSEHEYWNTQA
jgi:hypothetical protein